MKRNLQEDYSTALGEKCTWSKSFNTTIYKYTWSQAKCTWGKRNAHGAKASTKGNARGAKASTRQYSNACGAKASTQQQSTVRVKH